MTKVEGGKISAILLAAGKSERMGAFKQLLPLGGKTFVESCVDNLLASSAAEVIVVTGHNESAVRQVLAGRRVRFAYNPNYQLGMATSIIRGFEAVSGTSAAVMIALVDQPLVATAVIDKLISEYRASNSLILIPRHNGKRGHPILMSTRLKHDVESMDLSEGLRAVIETHALDISYVEVDSDSILVDFDYPEDYERIIADGKRADGKRADGKQE